MSSSDDSWPDSYVAPTALWSQCACLLFQLCLQEFVARLQTRQQLYISTRQDCIEGGSNQRARGQLMLIVFQYSLVFGTINFVFAIAATFLIDKIGRRLLLLTTFPFMSLLQLAIGLSFKAPEAHRNALVITFSYLFCVAYSIGEGPVPLVGGQPHTSVGT